MDGESAFGEKRGRGLSAGLKAVKRSGLKIAFFGHFGRSNFGNESTLGAMLYRLRRLAPDVRFTCICTGPEAVTTDYHIPAVPSRPVLVKPSVFHTRVGRWGRKLIVAVPNEIYRWLKGVKTLWGQNALVVPGTGLLTDAYTLFDWGPYEMFRWAVTAKLCRCKLLFVSVGAGPIYSRAGKFCVKAALSLADFRSYRDASTRQYLKGIGFPIENDGVSPDLAFSLPVPQLTRPGFANGPRAVVGIGLMEYAGRYSVEKPTRAVHSAYLETLVEFVRWLLANEYDVRLLIGDLADVSVTREFRALLQERSVVHDKDRIIEEPVRSVEDLLCQLATTDAVVATRFHNILLSLVLTKPVIAISFHHKCSSLMSQMGLAEYSQDINSLEANRLIEQFCHLRQNTHRLQETIREKVSACRGALNKQYDDIFRDICSDKKNVPPPPAEMRGNSSVLS